MRWLAILAMLPTGCLIAMDPPVLIDDPPRSGWVGLAVGTFDMCALTEEQHLWCGDKPGDIHKLSGTYRDVSASYEACALRSDGAIACSDFWSSYDEPAFGEPTAFIEIAGDSRAGCGRADGGEVSCWPNATAPPGSFMSIAAGGVVGSGDKGVGCGIRSDGRLQCWEIGRVVDEAVLTAPTGAFVDVAVGDEVACAITEAGAIRCWGDDADGLLDAPAGLGFLDVTVEDGYACAVDPAHAVSCWGEDTGDPTRGMFAAPADEAFVQIDGGFDRMCGITVDGTLRCWTD